jgi:hypothetical protein
MKGSQSRLILKLDQHACHPVAWRASAGMWRNFYEEGAPE